MCDPLVNPSAKFWNRAARALSATTNVAASLLFLGLSVLGTAQTSVESSRATKDRLTSESWWPTKGTAPFHAYVGESACHECHSEEVSSQVKTSMAEASFRIGMRT